MYRADNALPRELAFRALAGLEVTLLWDPRGDDLAVTVLDTRAGEAFWLAVDGADALDVFHHPYAYVTPSSAVQSARPAAAAGEGASPPLHGPLPKPRM